MTEQTAIIAHHGDETLHLTPDAGQTLEQALFLAGLFPGLPLCSGQGKCGLCRVRFVNSAPPPRGAERKKLSAEKIEQGWRLSCLHPATACEVQVPQRKQAVKAPESIVGELELAVDMGTTGLHWSALHAGKVVARGRELNPQMGLGSEIMSRLAYGASEAGRRTLSQLVSKRLEELCARLGEVKNLCISGNPAMTSLLLQQDVSTLARVPYSLPDACGGVREIPGSSLPPAYIPPHFAPFVGADISAGLAALILSDDPPPFPFVLADMGTNGEFLLVLSKNTVLAASVPLGPALEGVGLSFGRAASPGSVCRFELTPAGLATVPCEDTDDSSLAGGEHSQSPRSFMAGAENTDNAGAGEHTSPSHAGNIPVSCAESTGRGCLSNNHMGPDEPGISGTGYLSLVALLLRHGLLDASGRFTTGSTPLTRRLERELFDLHGETALRLPGPKHSAGSMQHVRGPQAARAGQPSAAGGMYLAASDVEELVKVKAAFNLALTRLCAEGGVAGHELGALCLAGAMGRHVNTADLETLGFLPRGSAPVVRKVGNTSLRGAELLLASPDARRYVESLPAPRVLDLATEPDFAQSYVTRMVFEHV